MVEPLLVRQHHHCWKHNWLKPRPYPTKMYFSNMLWQYNIANYVLVNWLISASRYELENMFPIFTSVIIEQPPLILLHQCSMVKIITSNIISWNYDSDKSFFVFFVLFFLHLTHFLLESYCSAPFSRSVGSEQSFKYLKVGGLSQNVQKSKIPDPNLLPVAVPVAHGWLCGALNGSSCHQLPSVSTFQSPYVYNSVPLRCCTSVWMEIRAPHPETTSGQSTKLWKLPGRPCCTHTPNSFCIVMGINCETQAWGCVEWEMRMTQSLGSICYVVSGAMEQGWLGLVNRVEVSYFHW